MAESSQRVIRLPRRTLGTIVPRNFGAERISKFGRVCLALWPEKPAVNLSQRARCTERAAQFYITGERDPSLGAILVIVDEIRGRRRV
jgi:hypothetical protein